MKNPVANGKLTGYVDSHAWKKWEMPTEF